MMNQIDSCDKVAYQQHVVLCPGGGKWMVELVRGMVELVCVIKMSVLFVTTLSISSGISGLIMNMFLDLIQKQSD